MGIGTVPVHPIYRGDAEEGRTTHKYEIRVGSDGGGVDGMVGGPGT